LNIVFYPDYSYTYETETEQELENDPPDILDIDIEIQSMRNTKAPGIDNIPIKLIKKGGQLLINMLHSLIKRIWIAAKVPVEWKTNIVVLIYKFQGDNLQCHNY
jgi:hypothetical protein